MSRWLITGGTGSLGRRLILDLLAQPDVIAVCFSRDEYKQAQLAALYPQSANLRCVLGDVRDLGALRRAMRGVDVVIHAAALKRVDALAYNPREVIATNVDGTANVCDAAIAEGVRVVVTVSSDKAVQPTNLYGASKQMAEHITIASNSYAPHGPDGAALTRLACVRYGNVLGSRGSVLQVWREALRLGAPLRVTDPRMTRFWLTLAQASAFVRAAAARCVGGEVLVPDLPAVMLGHLLDAMAPAEASVEVVGLRPGGEKRDEVLLSDEEATRTRRLEDGTLMVVPSLHPWTEAPWPGEPVPEGFQLSSGTARRLDAGALAAMLAEVP